MKLRNTIAILGLVALQTSALDLLPRLAALAQIESGGKDHKIGRAGERSQYQIMKSVWDDVGGGTDFSKCKGRSATRAAMRHASRLTLCYYDKHQRYPSAAQFYCMWNMGFDGFAKRDFLVSACPRRVQERAERFANLVAALKEEGK